MLPPISHILTLENTSGQLLQKEWEIVPMYPIGQYAGLSARSATARLSGDDWRIDLALGGWGSSWRGDVAHLVCTLFHLHPRLAHDQSLLLHQLELGPVSDLGGLGRCENLDQ